MSRKLKFIIGTAQLGSRVVDAETGEDIHGVTNVSVVSDASTKFTPVAKITVLTQDMEMAKEQMGPLANSPAEGAPAGEMEQLGKICYDVLRSHFSWWPDRWEQLSRDKQSIWEAAARAVGERVIAELQIAERASE